jgi:undecaprenyl phosphate N,N'-diacetylbacillosamine 1-phosphate transferase
LFKSIFDFVVGLVAFIVTFPVIVLVAVILAIANGGTPFFTQMRPGKHGKPFRLVKFKTMNDLKDGDGDLLPDDMRLTKIGRMVRESSLDELPQLVNVLKGEMSLVGPRPLLMEYLPLYDARQARRHDVKPGITGWAQINGRNALPWAEKFKLDVWYVDNQSFSLDIRILFLTIMKVFKREGISSATTVTMEKFTGNV